ncbi:MAG: hypothetical protein ACYDCC_07990 [Actinomycetota bacterium]
MDEIKRVLKHHGRFSIAVWGPRNCNPWLGIIFDVVSETLGVEIPPPGIPHPFSFDDEARLRSIFSAANFESFSLCELPIVRPDTSFDEWLLRTSSLAGPLANRLSILPEDLKAKLIENMREAVRPYQTESGLQFPGVSLIVSGTRA